VPQDLVVRPGAGREQQPGDVRQLALQLPFVGAVVQTRRELQVQRRRAAQLGGDRTAGHRHAYAHVLDLIGQLTHDCLLC
jgi:hypothetical protein